MSKQLRVNPIACTGHGLCAELLPELITLDEWGYPVLAGQQVPALTVRHGAPRPAARPSPCCSPPRPEIRGPGRWHSEQTQSKRISAA